MSSPIFSSKLPYKVRCSIPDCFKPVNLVFRTEMPDSSMLNFCSPDHAHLGRSRWREKLDKNMSGGIPVITTDDEYVGANIPGGGGE